MTEFPGRAKLFSYAVIFHPKATKEQREASETPKSILVTGPTIVLALNPEQVGILAARSIVEEYADKLEDVEIVVRPF